MKIFRQIVFALFISLILSVSTAHAEIQTYEDVGEYFMNDETMDFAKNQAELHAERKILEQVCVYVKNVATMIDTELDNDEIITIAAGILYITDTKFSMAEENGEISVKAFVTAQIDSDELKNLLEQAVKSKISDE